MSNSLLNLARSAKTCFALGAPVLLSGFASVAFAQAAVTVVPPSAAQAQARYEISVNRCNNGLPPAERDDCLKAARDAMADAMRGGPVGVDTTTSLDRRANIVPQSELPTRSTAPLPPEAATQGVTSNDGRATVIPPSNLR